MHSQPGYDFLLSWVEGEAWRNDSEIGLFVIVEKAFVGLVPKSEPHALSRGEAGRFRISNILPDGKIELSSAVTRTKSLRAMHRRSSKPSRARTPRTSATNRRPTRSAACSA